MYVYCYVILFCCSVPCPVSERTIDFLCKLRVLKRYVCSGAANNLKNLFFKISVIFLNKKRHCCKFSDAVAVSLTIFLKRNQFLIRLILKGIC